MHAFLVSLRKATLKGIEPRRMEEAGQFPSSPYPPLQFAIVSNMMFYHESMNKKSVPFISGSIARNPIHSHESKFVVLRNNSRSSTGKDASKRWYWYICFCAKVSWSVILKPHINFATNWLIDCSETFVGKWKLRKTWTQDNWAIRTPRKKNLINKRFWTRCMFRKIYIRRKMNCGWYN